MILTATIFGLTVAEFVAVSGFITVVLGYLISLNVYVKTKLSNSEINQKNFQEEIKIRLLDIEERMTTNKKEVETTALNLKIETEKINYKLDQKMDKLEEKIDHIINLTNEIKVNCAKQICNIKK
jgi:hypothetical protein